MDNFNIKSMVELLTKSGIISVLVFIIFYFGSQFLTSIQQVQKELASIRIQITKVQVKILTPETVEKMIRDKTLSREDVEKIIDQKIKILEYHYHNTGK